MSVRSRRSDGMDTLDSKEAMEKALNDRIASDVDDLLGQLTEGEDVGSKPESESEPSDSSTGDGKPDVPESSAGADKDKSAVAPEPEVVDEATELRRQLAEVSRKLAEAEAAKSAESVPAAPVLEDQEFITQDEFDEVMGDPSKVNALLNRAVKQAVAKARELVLSEVPGAVTPMVTQQIERRALVDRFYQENPELSEHRDYVKFIGSEMAQANPDMPLAEYFPKLAAEVKRRLRLGPRKEAGKPKKEEPLFASSGRSARQPGTRQMSREERDVLDLIGG